MTRPASYTPPVTAGTSPASAGNQRFNLQRPPGLLEPCAAMSGTHGSEGGSAGQPAGPTQPCVPEGGVRPARAVLGLFVVLPDGQHPATKASSLRKLPKAHASVRSV